MLVAIPTRNRPALARNAIVSVLGQERCKDVHVLVSDNSSDSEARRNLRTFCEKQEAYGGRLRYIETPSSLPMSSHWEWVIRKGLANYDLNHFSFLTDRMVFKDNHLQEILRLIAAFPDDVISYDHDKIDDYTKPVTIEQAERTGKVLSVESERLLTMASRTQLYSALPRMLNCVVPRAVLNQVARSFGTVFDSIAPDFNFCFKLLSTINKIVYFDKAPLVHYALDRSNGASYVRGIPSKDNMDFKRLSSDKWDASPFPQIRTNGNLILHEYCLVQRSKAVSRMPPVDIDAYLELFLAEARDMIEPGRRSATVRLVQSYKKAVGGTLAESDSDVMDQDNDAPPHSAIDDFVAAPIRTIRRYLGRSKLVVRCYRHLMNQYWVHRALYLGCPAPDFHRPYFKSTEQALRFLNKCSRAKVETNNHTVQMLGGCVLSISRGRST